ncbi:MAG: hypothetical protein KJO38_08340, partial [Gammaproteobacteria bacterium]|nr:hypothetical protein [Gammaproteobacteria bacterium]
MTRLSACWSFGIIARIPTSDWNAAGNKVAHESERAVELCPVAPVGYRIAQPGAAAAQAASKFATSSKLRASVPCSWARQSRET